MTSRDIKPRSTVEQPVDGADRLVRIHINAEFNVDELRELINQLLKIDEMVFKTDDIDR